MKYSEHNKLFTEHHHGFRVGRSYFTNLLETPEHWTDDLDNGSCVDMVFLDYQKAFNTVPHKRLILKLKS